jgi:RNA polymerase sigma factor (sigma-70 family)
VADDRALLERVRGGDRAAYGELYERHVDAARRYARSRLSNDEDADDAVADVFASVLSTIEGGKGPVEDFVPYLIASVRHQCERVNRRAQRELADDLEGNGQHDTGAAAADSLAAIDEAEVVRAAYEALPAHFRDVLWWTEVAETSHDEIAREVGSTPRAIAVLASRARQALAAAYLERHLAGGGDAVRSRSCRHVHADLASVVRGSAGRRRLRRVEDHLAECAECRDARDSLSRINGHLRALPLLPVGALAAYLKGHSGAKAMLVGWLSTPAAKVAAGSLLVAGIAIPVGVHEGWFDAAASPTAVEQVDGADGSAAALPTQGVGGTRTARRQSTSGALVPGTGSTNLMDQVLSTLHGIIKRALAQAPLATKDPGGQIVPSVSDAPAPTNGGGVAVPDTLLDGSPLGAPVPTRVPTITTGTPTSAVPVVTSPSVGAP